MWQLFPFLPLRGASHNSALQRSLLQREAD
jgi:hypothetical protein